MDVPASQPMTPKEIPHGSCFFASLALVSESGQVHLIDHRGPGKAKVLMAFRGAVR